MQLLGIIAAIVLALLIIIIHEFGHFASAKLLGVQVNEFSVGMGPLIWKKQKGETQYSLRAIPFGGYCKLEGEIADDAFDEAPKDPNPRAFNIQPAWKKIIILAAGVFMNLLLSIIIFTIVFWQEGSYTTYLESVVEGGPAQEAGIMAGDKVVAVNGLETDSWEAVCAEIDANGGKSINFSVERNGQVRNFTLEPEFDESLGRSIIGITCHLEKNFGYGVRTACRECFGYINDMSEWIASIFKGQASTDDVVGLVGVVSIVGESAKYGFLNVLYLMGALCMNLAYINALPFPALDGGRILFTIVNRICGGKISAKAEAIINAAGMACLLLLMIFLIFRDTIRLFI